MPLMMAGLQMAASNNPDMLGALGEGGIAGLKEYARQEKEKREDAKDKIELDLKKVDAIQKIKGRDLEHELEIDLKYRDTGKVVDVMISDETGTPKKAEIRSYYSYKEDKFKTEFIGWSPLSSAEFKEIEEELYALATEQLQNQLDSDDYAEQVIKII